MAVIMIKSICVKTTGQLKAEITGIEPGVTDQIVGRVSAAHGVSQVHWDLSGICRDQSSNFNIDCATEEIQRLLRLAKALSDLVEGK